MMLWAGIILQIAAIGLSLINLGRASAKLFFFSMICLLAGGGLMLIGGNA